MDKAMTPDQKALRLEIYEMISRHLCCGMSGCYTEKRTTGPVARCVAKKNYGDSAARLRDEILSLPALADAQAVRRAALDKDDIANIIFARDILRKIGTNRKRAAIYGAAATTAAWRLSATLDNALSQPAATAGEYPATEKGGPR